MDEEYLNNSIETLGGNSADIYLYKHRVKTNVIYLVVLIAIAVVIVLLPFVYVDITVSAVGYVRPITEKATVTASMTEIVDSVYVREGQKVQKGDRILTLRTEKNSNQQKYRLELIRGVNTKILDLEQLVKGRVPKKFASMEILQEYNHYLSQRRQISTDLEQYKIEWERHKYLFDAGLIYESEYNQYYYQYEGKKNEQDILDHNLKSVWQTELYNLRKEREEYFSTDNDLKSESMLYEVRSPVSGYLERFSGIYKGSSVSAGQQIAVVSPIADLCLNVYVSPRDIAFIKRGQEVRIQIDALNYNEWGALHGNVSEISSDMSDDGSGNYYYKVKCELDNNCLTLRNTGRKVFIKKGMSATAHFIVTRQSLFTLIYKNIDEWANPTQYNPGK